MQELDLAQAYPTGRQVAPQRYRLRAIACFYMHHFTAFARAGGGATWRYADDAQVSTVGKAGTWGEVLEQCEKGGLQPSLLFYERA